MRTVNASEIIKAVREMCISANYNLPTDIQGAIVQGKEAETAPLAKDIMDIICENYKIAEDTQVPICQDTGVATVFVEIGQEVFVLGSLENAINEGVRRGYKEGYLRASVVGDPLNRVNTKDNTPAFITYSIVEGDKLKITVAPKGFGSENMSALKMLTPSDGVEGVMDFVVNTVKNAGSNPCPPIVVGVGIGGTFDKVALLAKKALLRRVTESHPDEYYRNLEKELLRRINALDIGPQGFGGVTTALGVNIEMLPTHIAGLPCAVNINCHVTRRETCEL